MSLADQIAADLPFLRRFARALSGSQRSGDAYVASTLETLVADPGALAADVSPRVALYRVFLKLWSSLRVNLGRGDDIDLPAGHRSLERLTPRARQAFLLRAVEGFTPEEVAQVFDIGMDEAEGLLERASREIAAQIETDVLIIEDEPMIAMDIEELAEDLGHRIVGIARTHGEAVALAKAKAPRLILADIQLADGSSGVEAVSEILSSFDVPVIFITAFPEQLLTGRGLEPAFLITKPYQTEAVRAAISQALFFHDGPSDGRP